MKAHGRTASSMSQTRLISYAKSDYTQRKTNTSKALDWGAYSQHQNSTFINTIH